MYKTLWSIKKKKIKVILSYISNVICMQSYVAPERQRERKG